MPLRSRTSAAESDAPGNALGWSVRTYLIVIAGTALVAVLGTSVYGFVWSNREARMQALDDMSVLADRGAEEIAESISLGHRVISGLAAQPGIDDALVPSDDCSLTLESVGVFPSVRLDVIDAAGNVTCTSSDDPAVSAPEVHAASAWVERARGVQETVVLWDAVDAVAGRPSVVVASSIGRTVDQGGLVAGVLHVDELASTMVDELPGAERVAYLVVDRSADAVMSRPVGGAVAEAEIVIPDDGRGDWDVAGEVYHYAAAAVPDSPWSVIATVSRAEVTAVAQGALWREVLLGLAGLVFVGGATGLLDRRVAGPLRRISGAVAGAGVDPAASRVEVAGTREIAILATAVNDMLDIRAGHEAKLRHHSTHDHLTGLLSTTGLLGRLDDALDQASDQGASGVSLIAVGLDRFDLVHQSRGYSGANEVLRHIADHLRSAVPDGAVVGRGTGEIFLVMSPDADGAGGIRLADRLHGAFELPLLGNGGEDLSVRATLGIAHAAAGSEPEKLLEHAYTALFHAQRSGDGQAVFRPDMATRAAWYLEVDRDLSLALDGEQLFVHYQPVLDVASGRIVGAEALVRWQHPVRGVVAPMEFIPIAEETGQIIRIGQFVLAQACRQAAEWSAAGHPLRVSVNVSAEQLRNDDLPGLVAELLTETGLPAGRLCLEITESSLMGTSETTRPALRRLRRMGVQIAIDDFGTGYSSLAYLHELPVDELKIDRSFISRVGSTNGEPHLLDPIIAMAHALDLAVVAEGVETPFQLDALTGLGCDLAQGYLFGAPAPAEGLTTMLARQHAREPSATGHGVDVST